MVILILLAIMLLCYLWCLLVTLDIHVCKVYAYMRIYIQTRMEFTSSSPSL